MAEPMITRDMMLALVRQIRVVATASANLRNETHLLPDAIWKAGMLDHLDAFDSALDVYIDRTAKAVLGE